MEVQTAGHYVIIAENERKKKTLAELKSKYETLIRAHRELEDERESEKKESYEVTEHLRKELLSKTDKIIKLEALLEKKDIETEEMKAHLETVHRNDMDKLSNDWEERLKEKEKEIDGLQNELLAIQMFKQTKMQMEEETQNLKHEIERLMKGQDVRVRELERKFIEQTNKQKQEYEKRVEYVKRNAEADIDERLSLSTKRILQQNRRLAEELHMHVQETSILQADKKALEEDNKVLTRELDIKRESEEEYAKRGSKQAQELRDTQKKIQALERSLAQTVKDSRAEKETMSKRFERERKDQRQEKESLNRLLKLKTRELKNIRKLAREVLQQRSNVETFLISSLGIVKQEITQRKLPSLTSSRGGEGGGRRGVEGRGMEGDRDAFPGGTSLDIADLSWEDRESVLRLLFSKINSQTQQATFARMPEHSFEMEPRAGEGLLPRLSGRRHGSIEEDDASDAGGFLVTHGVLGELAPMS